MIPGVILAGLGSSQVLPAREQMAFTLGFHVILVPFGVAFTTLMMMANYRAIRHDDAEALLIAQRWSKVAAVLFAVGAVSGTVLSFELGLLWPGLMGRFGAAYGIPFGVEAIFFFLEAIYIAIYIYGWKRLRPWTHFWTGLPVVLSGIGGTLSVVAANSWMNLPGGITLRNGNVVDVHPLAVFFNRAFWYEGLHMLLAAYLVAGFLTAAVYAAGMLKRRSWDGYQRLGFLIPFTVAAVVIPVQIFVGDTVAREAYKMEPAKFAAIEMLTQTRSDVPETLGGYLGSDGKVHDGIRLPGAASLLAGFSTRTVIRGLDAVPAAVRPKPELVTIVHLSFDVMVAISFALLALAAWFGLVWWRRRDIPASPWFLRCSAAAGILSVVCLETGWVVTEVGRQPWTVMGLLLTRDAVTTSGNVWFFFAGTVLVLGSVGVAAIFVLGAMKRRWQAGLDRGFDVPYGPDQPLEAAVEEAAPR
ncbi:MAG: cytochrome d ubiquinol oxidase subunit [Actinobacteria bacterium]|nr:cytochrome d ubiquinol oxidase subunit [Actinomycetota bacterium]